MSVTCLCQSVVVSVNIFCLSVFVCELTFGELSVGELSHNVPTSHIINMYTGQQKCR